MIRRQKELKIGGISAEELAERYGTPLYVYDREAIRKQYKKLEKAFDYENFQVNYAVKANSNPSVVETLVEEGAGLDCASRAELKLARELGADDIIYTAPFNTREELEYATDNAEVVNLDAIFLLEKMDEMPELLSFRIDPGMGEGDFGLLFGGGDTKFGVPEERAVEAYRKAKELGIERFGIHMMTGSNVREEEYFAEVTEKLLKIAGRIAEELEIEFEFVDIGGGLGVPYEPDEEEFDIEKAASKTVDAFEKGLEKYDLGDPTLKIEPGRYLVAQSGVLLTKVTGIKEKSGRTFVGSDTGMHQMIRPMLLDAYHEILVANDLERANGSEKNVVGPVCSSTDIMAEERELPEMERGDILSIMDAGAYGFTMASHWNSRPLPAEVMVEYGEAELIRERERKEAVFHGTKVE